MELEKEGPSIEVGLLRTGFCTGNEASDGLYTGIPSSGVGLYHKRVCSGDEAIQRLNTGIPSSGVGLHCKSICTGCKTLQRLNTGVPSSEELYYTTVWTDDEVSPRLNFGRPSGGAGLFWGWV